MHKLQELVRLHRMGTGAREVSRLLKISPNTERFWRTKFADAGLLDGEVDSLPDIEVLEAVLPAKQSPQQTSSVVEVEGEIRHLMTRGATPKAIHDRLRLDRPGFEGSYFAVKRLCARVGKRGPPKPEEVAIPVETVAGHVAQVDFGEAGWMMDPDSGKLRRAWVFVMVLGHSRHQFVRAVFDQRAATWQQLHVEAFAFFGGVPAVVVPDNLKSAVIRSIFGLGEDPALNRSYVEVARHYGFKIDPTPPYSPKKKGKVERSVQYVKRNAIRTMPETLDIREANRQLARWTTEIAGTRQHGITRRKPLEVFEAEERAALLELPKAPFVPVVWKEAKVHRDSHVVFEEALYSVPWRHLGVQAWIRAMPNAVTIYIADQRVADHPRCGPGKRSTQDTHLPEERRDQRHRGRDWWESQARAIGPETGALISEIFDDDGVLYPIRKVQGIVTHLRAFPAERAEGAARRARRYHVHSYGGIKEILTKGLDLEPPAPELPLGMAASYRFTRSVNDMLDRHFSEDVQ
jgi:transposase